MQSKVFSGFVASAVAGLLISGSGMATGAAKAKKEAPKKAGAKADAKVAMYCANNNCAGHSECKGHGNDGCKGQNSCKGKGWITGADEKACTEAGGAWTKDAK